MKFLSACLIFLFSLLFLHVSALPQQGHGQVGFPRRQPPIVIINKPARPPVVVVQPVRPIPGRPKHY